MDVDSLAQRVKDLEAQVKATNEELQAIKGGLATDKFELLRKSNHSQNEPKSDVATFPLRLDEYKRYGRQLILPEIGVQGQLCLKHASVLVIGAGGLGCPAAAYLAGSGIGSLGIVDGDVVEQSNLHRQILHTTVSASFGTYKAISVKNYVHSLNPSIECEAHVEHLSPSNAANIVLKYDLILDCTDTPSSRYLFSDIAIALEKPLVSASALRTEGQLIVLNHPVGKPGSETGGPCYRCVFPHPPAPETVTSCGEGGILGPVVGVMGVMQALEAIKIIVKDDLSGCTRHADPGKASMLVFSAFDSPMFRSVKLRGRRKGCRSCSKTANVSLESIQSSSKDYAQECAAEPVEEGLESCERVTAQELSQRISEPEQSRLIIDIREKAHFDVFHLPGSLNVPYTRLHQYADLSQIRRDHEVLQKVKDVYIICRLGNDSQLAVRKLKGLGSGSNGFQEVRDVEGGWKAWRKTVPGIWPEF